MNAYGEDDLLHDFQRFGVSCSRNAPRGIDDNTGLIFRVLVLSGWTPPEKETNDD